MNKLEQTIKVTIAGMDFRVKSNSDNHAERIRDVAKYVDEKFQETKKEHPSFSSIDITTLVAMNICEELFTEKAKHELQRQ